jgi:UDP-N-acetylmuramoyl-L-alanyl-D-glutamate--2,6-diaminopimelate ligase
MMPKHMSFSSFSTLLGTFGIDISELKSELTTLAAHSQLVNDSREIKPGDVFCAIEGDNQPGRQYIHQGIQKGCALVLAECKTVAEHGQISFTAYMPNGGENKKIAIIEFYQLNQQLFELAKAYYQAPQNDMAIIGITGTNGKTTTSQLLAQLLDVTGSKSAVIGTNGAGCLAHLLPIKNTTPGATELHQLFNRFLKQDISHTVMEVSSHALMQRRVLNSLFDIAVYTNLSRDHLDYHGDMASYAAAKKLIFTENTKQIAVINGGDEIGRQWLPQLNQQQTVIVYGRRAEIAQQGYYIRAENIKHHQRGISFTLKTHLGEVAITSPLMGDFNVDNLLASIAVLIALSLPDSRQYNKHQPQIDLSELAKKISALKSIKGRMELFSHPLAQKAVAVVDYAHTPDALENSLRACKQHCQGELWVIFGCGGDRDKGKRPLMGAIAEQLAHHVIITTDNPRSEIADDIVKDILAGCKNADKITLIADRQEAVFTALNNAGEKDMVLFAGKGHEKTIVSQNKIYSYDERAVVAGYMSLVTGKV